MGSYSLVPVDHQPDFSNYSLVPVDHNPFSADDMVQQARTQLATQPARLATGADPPDVGAPLIGDGGQSSPGVPWANKAADVASKFAFGLMNQLVTLPQRAIDASAQDMQHFGEEGYTPQAIGPAVETAMLMAGAGAPMAESGAVGALGGKLPRLGAAESSKVLPEELAGQARTQLPGLAVDKGPVPGATDVASGAAATEQTAATVANDELSANAPTGKFYSVVYEHKLRPESYRASRETHNQMANEAFLQNVENDKGFALGMQDMGVKLQRTPTGLAPRKPPAGFSWHHAEEPGVMQLVPREQHDQGSIFKGVLHPNGGGGYSKWGK